MACCHIIFISFVLDENGTGPRYDKLSVLLYKSFISVKSDENRKGILVYMLLFS